MTVSGSYLLGIGVMTHVHPDSLPPLSGLKGNHRKRKKKRSLETRGEEEGDEVNGQRGEERRRKRRKKIGPGKKGVSLLCIRYIYVEN